MIALLWLLNFGISVFNSVAVGFGWVESKAAGGWARLMAWAGATMAACGFTWCYLVVLAYLAGPSGFHTLPPKYVSAMFSLGWLTIIVPVLGSGLAITLDSWAYFWRRRTFGSGAVAAYNTFAQGYNIYEAVREMPSAWDTVKEVLFPSKKSSSSSSSDDSDASGKLIMIAILLAVLAVASGILTAAAIISTVSGRVAATRRLERELSR
jgi:hypothetical protein